MENLIFEFIKKNKTEQLINATSKDLECTNVEGLTPLNYAVSLNDLDSIKLLLKKGSDINALDDVGLCALEYSILNANTEIFYFLLSHEANVNINREGFTLVHAAAISGNEMILKELIKKGLKPKINSKDEGGRTPLLWAAQEGNKSIAAKLIELGADIDSSDNEGFTALEIATSENSVDFVKMLIESGVDVNKTTVDGGRAIHAACAWGNMEVLELLINAGAIVNIQDNEGMTPLHFACEHCFSEIAELLLLKRAEFNYKNAEGRTASDIAKENNCGVILKLIG